MGKGTRPIGRPQSLAAVAERAALRNTADRPPARLAALDRLLDAYPGGLTNEFDPNTSPIGSKEYAARASTPGRVLPWWSSRDQHLSPPPRFLRISLESVESLNYIVAKWVPEVVDVACGSSPFLPARDRAVELLQVAQLQPLPVATCPREVQRPVEAGREHIVAGITAPENRGSVQV
jgi:hypothetical protein